MILYMCLEVRSRTTTVPVPDEEDGESSGAEGAPDWGYNVAPHRPRLVDVPAVSDTNTVTLTLTFVKWSIERTDGKTDELCVS